MDHALKVRLISHVKTDSSGPKVSRFSASEFPSAANTHPPLAAYRTKSGRVLSCLARATIGLTSARADSQRPLLSFVYLA